MRDEQKTWLALLGGVAGPVGVAAVLVPVRDHTDNTNVALVLALVVVAVASLGRRLAAALSAFSAAACFDFFHTRPYYSFRISGRGDVATGILLLLVGGAVGELAVRLRRHHLAARRGESEIALLHGTGELVASGTPARLVAAATATELKDLLSLRDCRFDEHVSIGSVARLECNGDVMIGDLRWAAEKMGLPGKEVELPVLGGGRRLGRFVLVPTPGHPVAVDRRLVAVTVAAQVGAALALEAGAGSPDTTEHRRMSG